jgi:hypothetical protein
MMNDNHQFDLVAIDMNVRDRLKDLNRVDNQLIVYIDQKMLRSFHNWNVIENDLGEKMKKNYQENNLEKDVR